MDDAAPLENIYDARILGGLGYQGNIESATLKAFADGKRGHVEYSFKKHKTLSECIAGFDLQKTRNEAPEAQFAAIGKELEAGAISPQEALVRASCAVVGAWRDHLGDWLKRREFNQRITKNQIKDHDAHKASSETFHAGKFYDFAAVIMDSRKEFLNLFRRYQPMIRRHKKGKPQKIGENTTRMPGFVVHSGNASPEFKKELGL